MYKIRTKTEIEITCDQCSRKSDDPKLDGWFIGFGYNPAHLGKYQDHPALLAPYIVSIETWDEGVAQFCLAKHLCGMECATNFVQNVLYDFQRALPRKEKVAVETQISCADLSKEQKEADAAS